MYELGQFLRDRYDDFLGEELDVIDVSWLIKCSFHSDSLGQTSSTGFVCSNHSASKTSNIVAADVGWFISTEKDDS